MGPFASSLGVVETCSLFHIQQHLLFFCSHYGYSTNVMRIRIFVYSSPLSALQALNSKFHHLQDLNTQCAISVQRM